MLALIDVTGTLTPGRVFCDQTNLTEDVKNYTLFLPQWYYVVSPKSKIERYARAEAE